jgi:hypothetical protein
MAKQKSLYEYLGEDPVETAPGPDMVILFKRRSDGQLFYIEEPQLQLVVTDDGKPGKVVPPHVMDRLVR